MTREYESRSREVRKDKKQHRIQVSYVAMEKGAMDRSITDKTVQGGFNINKPHHNQSKTS